MMGHAHISLAMEVRRIGNRSQWISVVYISACGSYMINIAYEREVDTRGELLQWIFEAAGQVNGAAALNKVTISTAE